MIFLIRILYFLFKKATCLPSSNFLMTAVIGVYSNLQNVWIFSKCSIALWKIQLLNRNTTLNTQCSMLSNIPSINTYSFTNYKPGKLWNFDHQCQLSMNWTNSSAKACGVF
jgi:hypothetical protein